MNKVRTQKHLAILESNFKSSGGEGEMLICYLLQYVCVCAQSCPTLCNPMDYSPPGSTVHGDSPGQPWSGLPCPSPGDRPNPWTESASLMSPALAGFFTSSTTWKAQRIGIDPQLAWFR